MSRRWLALLAWAATLAACEAPVGGPEPSSAKDGGSARAGEGGASHDRCAGDGVRLCAPALGCPGLTNAACPGTGCRDVDTLNGQSTSNGVCWSDIPDLGDVDCSACDDGESCIGRGSTLRCVPDDVCRAFWDLGVRDVCVYADKRAYTGDPLPPEPTTCPGAPGQGTLCGGACGACLGDEAQRCVGRSPAHPVGVCAWLPGISEANDPAAIPTCALVAGAYQLACPDPDLVCGVFSAPALQDHRLAQDYGLCMPQAMCESVVASLPGGFGCYSAWGFLVAGH